MRMYMYIIIVIIIVINVNKFACTYSIYLMFDSTLIKFDDMGLPSDTLCIMLLFVDLLFGLFTGVLLMEQCSVLKLGNKIDRMKNEDKYVGFSFICLHMYICM